MRFIADGPSIPDDLIIAHDEGREVLFCGSGVSRARADLPAFMGLASSVLDGIGSAKESRARKVKEAAEKAPKIDGLGALIAADTIFSQLEDEFPLDLIQKHVARALTRCRSCRASYAAGPGPQPGRPYPARHHQLRPLVSSLRARDRNTCGA